MREAFFSIDIAASEVQKYYRGQALTILVTTHQGKRLQFPANLILPYIAHDGVHGQFVLSYSDSGKAISLSRI